MPFAIKNLLDGWRFWAAASPAGWPPPQHGAAARRRRAAAPQNTTDSHFGIIPIPGKGFLNVGG